MFILIIPLVMGLIVAGLASSKGKSAITWFIYGVLLWPIALIHILVSNDGTKKCPKCFSKIDVRATACPFCQHKTTQEEIKISKEEKVEEEKHNNTMLLILVIIIVILFFLFKVIAHQ